MKKGFKIEVDDQFTPRIVQLSSDKKTMQLDMGDGKSSDNRGGGGRLTVSDKREGTQITIYLSKAAIAAIREVFINTR